MALIPNHFSSIDIDLPVEETADFTETMVKMSIESGYYRVPGSDGSQSSRSESDESVLLESSKTMINQFGEKIRRDTEEWDYDVYKGPPTEYRRQVEALVYLPGVGRQFQKVEEETIVYWTFTPYTDGDNLGRTRFISAFVVYDLPVDPSQPLSAEAQEKIEERGMKPGQSQDRIISSGKLWSEANKDSRIVEDENANQVTKWVENVIIEHDIVEDEIDKWTIWTVKKNSLRPGDVQVDGPRHIKKTGFSYQLPVELKPPTIKATSRTAGVNIEITGGGAEFTGRWFPQPVKIIPDAYNVYRAKIAEPPRDASGDKEGWWDPDPAPAQKPKIIGTSATTDQSGAPADPLPPSAGHSEPNDVSEPEPPAETYFTMLGTVQNDNEGRWRDEGHAEFLDIDVQTGGEYEYYAEAIYNEQVSPESNHERIIFTGGSSRSHRLGFAVRRNPDDGSTEVDIEAPDDPGVPPPDYGEVPEYDIPGEIPDDEIPDLIDDIAPRVFATNEPDFTISLDVLMPLLGLEYGQAVRMPEILWETYGKQLIMSQGTLPERWMLKGFSMSFERNKEGGWTSQRTNLKLGKRAGR